MNYPCTYYDIYRWNQEITQFLSKPKSILSIIQHEDKNIGVFVNDNKIKFEAVIQKVEELNKKYFVIVKDSEGKDTLNMIEGKPEFIEGQTEEAFQADLKTLFTTPSSVVI